MMGRDEMGMGAYGWKEKGRDREVKGIKGNEKNMGRCKGAMNKQRRERE